MRNHTTWAILVAVLGATGLTSCYKTLQAYPGAARANVEVATIFSKDGTTPEVIAVDGRANPGRAAYPVIKVLPGEHEFEVECAAAKKANDTTEHHRFLAQAGHFYEIACGSTAPREFPPPDGEKLCITRTSPLKKSGELCTQTGTPSF